MSTFHVGLIFCFLSSQFFHHPRAQTIIVHFPVNEPTFPIWNFSPTVFKWKFLEIAFPMTVLPKGDRADFVQEGGLDLPYWTMILAICALVDESKCLDIPIWEFWIKMVHIPFWPWCVSGYCVSCLSCASRLSWNSVHDSCGCQLWCWWSLLSEYSTRSWSILHNVASEDDSNEALTPNSLDDKDPSMTQSELFCPYSLLLRSPLFSDFSQLPCQYFLKFFPFFGAFASGLFFASGIGINLTKLQWLNELIPFADMWSSWHLCWSCASQYCGRFLRGNLLMFYKALLLASEFPTSYECFHGVFKFIIIWFDEEDTTLLWILWNLSVHPTILNLHQRSNDLQYVSPTSHLKLCR